MRLLTSLALTFYVLVITILGSIVILFVGHTFLFEDIANSLSVFYNDLHMRWLAGGIGGALITISFILARIISGTRQKERTIAFDNPSGRVSVSLGAVEDLIKRMMYRLAEIGEARLHIIATKKGIETDVRLTLKADVNIPELTSRLQELVKSKIQEILGIEEAVIVRIHVVKIASEESKSLKNKREGSEGKIESSTSAPFHGYRT